MNDNLQNIQQAYDSWAAVYDTNQNATRDLNSEIFRQQSLPVKSKRVLEVGCGTGINTVFLADHSGHVTAMDFSEEMIEKARQKLAHQNHVEFVTGDIMDPWPFASQSFHFVTANLVLEHIEDLVPLFREAFRVLVPGGFFYMSELHPYRQIQKSQARFIDENSGNEILVEAHIHSISQFINSGIAAGFGLIKAGEHKNETDTTPRLLTLLFNKPAPGRSFTE